MKGRALVFDSIYRVSRSGESSLYWSSYDARNRLRELHGPTELDQLPEPVEFARAVYRRLRGKYLKHFEYYHTNAISILGASQAGEEDARFRAGNVLVSLRNANAVVILDAIDQAPLWVWGPGELDLQHDPVWLPSGRMLVFDNGTLRGWTRVIEVESSGSIVWSFPPSGISGLRSKWRGGSQRLPNGNTLICESERGRVVEVTSDGRVVWEFWNRDFNDEGKRRRIYRFSRIPRERLEHFLPAEGFAAGSAPGAATGAVVPPQLP